jgi:N-methylhydantoinase B
VERAGRRGGSGRGLRVIEGVRLGEPAGRDGEGGAGIIVEERYGVVLTDGAVDAVKTAALRERMAGTPGKAGFYDLGPYREVFESVWTDANYDALTQCLASLPVHWRFYAKHRIFAAIDAIEPAARKGDGGEVRAVFQELLLEFPQLTPAAAE